MSIENFKEQAAEKKRVDKALINNIWTVKRQAVENDRLKAQMGELRVQLGVAESEKRSAVDRTSKVRKFWRKKLNDAVKEHGDALRKSDFMMGLTDYQARQAISQAASKSEAAEAGKLEAERRAEAAEAGMLEATRELEKLLQRLKGPNASQD